VIKIGHGACDRCGKLFRAEFEEWGEAAVYCEELGLVYTIEVGGFNATICNKCKHDFNALRQSLDAEREASIVSWVKGK
jgi:hypothetical protein